MKRFLSMLLVFSLCTALLPVNLYAASSPNENEVYLIEDVSGHFKESSYSTKSASIIRATEDNNYENIYRDSGNQYYQKIQENDYVKVLPVTTQLSNTEALEDLNKQYEIPNEIYQDMLKMSELSKERQTDQATVTFFVEPSLSKALTRSTMPDEVTYYNSNKYIHRQVYYNDQWTTWQTITRGSTSEAVLNTIKEITMYGISTVAEEILGAGTSIISTGISILQSWKNVNKYTPIYADSKNKTQLNVRYNILYKYTYYVEPMKQQEFLGCSTQKARITQIDTDVYLNTKEQGMKRSLTSYEVDRLYYSPNFKKPEPIAFTHYQSVWTETVEGRVHGLRLIFTK